MFSFLPFFLGGGGGEGGCRQVCGILPLLKMAVLLQSLSWSQKRSNGAVVLLIFVIDFRGDKMTDQMRHICNGSSTPPPPSPLSPPPSLLPRCGLAFISYIMALYPYSEHKKSTWGTSNLILFICFTH